jgi:hypothetical protein
MRAVKITGKHNIDKINEIGNASYKAVRKHLSTLDETLVTHPYQLDMLRHLYIIGPDYIAENISLFLSELNHKIQGYKGQDQKKAIHNPASLIILEDVLAKLVASQLTCDYCAKPILVLYKNVRDPRQWTLDRLDNSLGHTCANTCISCLKCNLQRRVMAVEKFTFTKKLRIQKGGNPPDPPLLEGEEIEGGC